MIDIKYNGDRITISGEYIDIKAVFDCGQFFRYFPDDECDYIIARDKLLFVKNTDEALEIYPSSREEFESFWYPFLRLDMSYLDTETEFLRDDVLKKTVPVCRGMRILHQDEFETLISFIISANNNIKRIKKIIESICVAAGEKRQVGKKLYYSFPTSQTLSRLTEAQLLECGAGYRAPYIAKTANAVKDGFDLNCIYDMSYVSAKKHLCTLMGVGPKVADCILLFSYNKFEAFPVDTWVKKILKDYYAFEPKTNDEAVRFAIEKFGGNAGIAQQYLFHYIRTQSSLQK